MRALILLLLPLTAVAADVGVVEITSETELYVDSTYEPQARVGNLGTDTAFDFLIIAEIYEGLELVYADTVVATLAPQDAQVVSFEPFTPSLGEYTLTVRALLEGDTDVTNDTLSVQMECGFCLGPDDYPEIDLKVENPVSTGSVRFSYVLPGGQLAEISIYDAAGRRVGRVQVSGIGSREFGERLPRGVYLVLLSTGSQMLSAKAVLLR